MLQPQICFQEKRVLSHWHLAENALRQIPSLQLNYPFQSGRKACSVLKGKMGPSQAAALPKTPKISLPGLLIWLPTRLWNEANFWQPENCTLPSWSAMFFVIVSMNVVLFQIKSADTLRTPRTQPQPSNAMCLYVTVIENIGVEQTLGLGWGKRARKGQHLRRHSLPGQFCLAWPWEMSAPLSVGPVGHNL